MKVNRVKLDPLDSAEEFLALADENKYKFYESQYKISKYWWDHYYELVEMKHRQQAIEYLISHAVISPSAEINDADLKDRINFIFERLSWDQLYQTLVSVYQISQGNFKYVHDEETEPVEIPASVKPEEEDHANSKEG